MENKPVAGIVAAAIAVIVLAGVLMPALDNATETHTTFKNEGYYRMAEFDDTASFTAKWDHTDPNAFTIDGVRYALPDTRQTIDPNIMCSENFFIRYNQFSGYAYVQGYADTFGGSYVARSDMNQDMNITVSNGTVVFDNGSGTTKTVSYTKMYAINNNGQFILKHSTDAAYVNGNSIIIGVGHSSNNIDTYLIGSLDDGFDREFRKSSNPSDPLDFTFSDVVVDSSTNSEYKDLYSLVSLSWTATNNSTQDTSDMIYSQFLVPYEVTAEKVQHLSDPMNAILNVIPIIIIVAVLLGVVAIFIIRRE